MMKENMFTPRKSICQLERNTKGVIFVQAVTAVLWRMEWSSLFILDGVIMGNPFISPSKPLSRCVVWNKHFIHSLNSWGIRASKTVLLEDVSLLTHVMLMFWHTYYNHSIIQSQMLKEIEIHPSVSVVKNVIVHTISRDYFMICMNL